MSRPDPPAKKSNARTTPPEPTLTEAEMDQVLTDKTNKSLHALRRQIKTTQMQQAMDPFLMLVNKKMATDREMSESRLPVQWRKGRWCTHEDWYACLALEISRAVVSYWDAILFGEWEEWESAIDRIDEIVETGVNEYRLAPRDPTGWCLMTPKEWKIEVAKRQKRQEILDRKRANR